MSDKNLTPTEKRDLRFITMLERLVATKDAEVKEMAAQVIESPVHAVESCATRIKKIIKGQMAAQILNSFGKDSRSQGTHAALALQKAVDFYYYRWKEALLHDAHRHYSTCPYTNAVADSKRGAACQMLEVLNLQYRKLAV